MLSTTIGKEIKCLLSNLEEAEYLNKILQRYTKLYFALNANLSGFNNAHKRIETPYEGFDLFKKKLNNINKTDKIEPRKLFVSIDKLQAALKEASFSNNEDILFIEESLENFSETYSNYLSSPRESTSWSLVVEAVSLYMLLTGFTKGLNIYHKNIEVRDLDFKNGSELIVILSTSMTLNIFTEKLQSIDKLYTEVCLLLNVSHTEHPLQIIKIESGSMSARLFGNSKVIGLITRFIEASAGYIYRRFTKEGQLTGIPKKVEFVESILKLNSKLEKEGVDTKELKDHISKSAVIIAKELNVLLSDQPEVTVNGKNISIGSEARKKLIESNNTLRIEKEK